MKKKGSGNEACLIKKVYVVIFVDISSRLVVLELFQDRNTESFLLAFMRMTAAYGSANTVLRHNAPEYHRANKEIQALMKIITSEETRKNWESGVLTRSLFLHSLSLSLTHSLSLSLSLSLSH